MTNGHPGITFDQLTRLDNRKLEPMMKSNAVPGIDDLVGYDFRGWNIAIATVILGTRKFIKGFYRGASPGRAWGYNMPVEQNGRDGPWLNRTKNGEPVRYYFYGVLPGAAVSDAIYPHTLVVDYRLWPEYSDLNPVKYTVDYLVYPDAANRDLVVGKSYTQVGQIKIFLGFFILERLRPTSYAGPSAGGS